MTAPTSSSRRRGWWGRGSGASRLAVAACCVLVISGCTQPWPRDWRYTTRVTSSAATVVWTDPRVDRVTCRVGDGSTAHARATAGTGPARSARVEGLRPDAAYRCRLEGEDAPVARVGFRTAPAGDAPFRFAVVGDSGDGSPAATALARRILAGRPAFLVHLGDLSYVGVGPGGYARGFFGPYRRLLARVPLFPTPGNHDVGRRSIYGTLFGPAADADDRAGPRYAFTWGAAAFASVSSVGLGSHAAAARWLDDALAHAPTDDWRIVFLHEPPFVPGRKWVTRGLRSALERVVAGEAPPALVLAGHEHVYARTAPICNRTPGTGTLEVVSGGGGANLDPAKEQPNFPIVLSITHYLRVSVRPATIDVRAIDVEGRVRDHVRIRRGQPVACRSEGWATPREKTR